MGIEIIKDPDIKGMLPVTLDTNVTKLDFWGYNHQEVTISNDAADTSEVIIDTLEIVAQNFAYIKFALKQFGTKIRNLIIKNCVISDWGNLTADTLTAVNYTDVTIPTPPVSTTLTSTIVEDPDDLAIRAELRGMCITPGSGEAVYGQVARNSLDRMLEIFPNMKQISPVICGFVTSTDLSRAKVLPGVESRTGATWQSGTYDRTTAHLISQNCGTVNFGGTPPDADLLSYLDYAKSKNLKVMLTPMLMVDTPDKPWRGDLQGSVADTVKWFNNEYKPWLLSYANLVRGKVDSFLIGSELKKISNTDDGSHTYPIIDLLISLAREVKEMLGYNVEVSYGADWSEYHHNDHAYRPMDKLWADPSIDFVGISAYFPITLMHTTRTTLADLIKAWRSGVAFNCWVDSEGTEHSMTAEWGFKAVEEWLSTKHYFDPSKTQPTLWQPNMKPMKFTEFGCASINKATNAPNVFGKSDGKLNGVIPYSTEKPDDRIQKLYIRSAIEAWRDNHLVPEIFCWSFDARGEHWYKNSYWADRGVHPYSHSLEGKIRDTLS